MHDDVELFLSDKINAESMEIYSVTDKNSGRIEKRTCYKTSDIEWLSKKSEWSGLTSIFALKREITTKYGTSEEMSYYISSLSQSVQKLLEITRDIGK